jgi:capsular exopolysaccharide synthesis family protein
MRADDQPAGLRELLGILSFRKWTVILVTLLVVGIALAYSFRQEPTYESSAEVLIQPVNFDPSLPPNSGFVNMPTEQRIAISSAVATDAASRLQSEGIPMAAISVEAIEGANALVFQTRSTIPEAAQATAQAFADSYLNFREKGVRKDLLDARRPIEARIRDLDREIEGVQDRLFGAQPGQTEAERAGLQVQFNNLLTQRAALQAKLNELIAPEFVRIGEILAPAIFPTEPSSPNHIRTGAFALFVGISLGVGLAFLRERMDERVHDRGDLEPTMGLPVLAAIPATRLRRRKEILTWSKPNSDVAEAYKALRTALMVSSSREGWRSLMVTSATPGEGKTFTAVNVAVALAHSDVKVILVSADLRRPGLGNYLHQSKRSGLSNLLAGTADVESALSEVQGIRNLRFLGSGSLTELNAPKKQPTSNHAAHQLGSKTMGEIVARLSGLADVVLLDTTPVLGIADAVALAPLVDAILMVVDTQRATRGSVQEAMDRLEGVGARVIGAVLTRYDAARSRAYYAHAGYATPSRYTPDADGSRRGSPTRTMQRADQNSPPAGAPTVPEPVPDDIRELPSRHEP